MTAPDFARLFHAYGPAIDTPEHLAALTGDDEDAQVRAVRHLWSAVLHQGTPGTVTPVAVRAVVAALGGTGGVAARGEAGDEERIVASAPSQVNDPELQAALLDFLTQVAEEGTVPSTERSELEQAHAAHPDVTDRFVAGYAAGTDEELYEDDVLTGAFLAEAALGCRDVQRDVLPAVTRFLTADDDEVRAAATRAVAAAHAVLTRDDAPPQDHALGAGVTRAAGR